jgi:hypothetical protein
MKQILKRGTTKIDRYPYDSAKPGFVVTYLTQGATAEAFYGLLGTSAATAGTGTVLAVNAAAGAVAAAGTIASAPSRFPEPQNLPIFCRRKRPAVRTATVREGIIVSGRAVFASLYRDFRCSDERHPVSPPAARCMPYGCVGQPWRSRSALRATHLC